MLICGIVFIKIPTPTSTKSCTASIGIASRRMSDINCENIASAAAAASGPSVIVPYGTISAEERKIRRSVKWASVVKKQIINIMFSRLEVMDMEELLCAS